jgi:hypothetical protein
MTNYECGITSGELEGPVISRPVAGEGRRGHCPPYVNQIAGVPSPHSSRKLQVTGLVIRKEKELELRMMLGPVIKFAISDKICMPGESHATVCVDVVLRLSRSEM